VSGGKPTGIEHVAGEMRGQVQLCSRCGVTLIDYRGTVTDTPGWRGGGWGLGSLVVVCGPAQSLLVHWDGPTRPCWKGAT
jgi:hypothetical protein